MLALVDDLLHVHADLVVTVTAPLDRQRPTSDENRILVRNLLADARRQVRETADADTATEVLRRLDAAAETIDLTQGAQGVVFVATADRSEAHLLPYPVRAAVALGSTPATRFLVQGLRRSPRYRLVVISDRATRLYDAIRDHLREVTDFGFPFKAEVVPRDLRAVAGRFARTSGRDDKEQWRNFYRQVDGAITAAGRADVLPLVLAGVRNSTALFDEVSHNRHLVIGRIDGAQEHANAHDLGKAAWPILRDHLKTRRRNVVSELIESFHADRAVLGIDDVWPLARQGRGRLLVVEEDYQAQPMQEVDRQLVPADTCGGDGEVMDDPVDELIEHVVRAGGAVEFVASDALADVGRVGLVLR